MNTTTLIGMVGAIALSACGGAPSSPSVPSPNTFLTGYVSNDIIGPISGALVTVAVGSSAGATAVTDSAGSFRVAYDDRTNGQLLVTKDGYASTTVTLRAPAGSPVYVLLHLATPPVRLDGSYTATFAAASECAQIPEILRTRSYAAVIEQAPQSPQSTFFDVTLSGASFAPAQQGIAGTLNSFFGVVEANSVVFRIFNRLEASEITEGIREAVAPNVLLEIEGEAKLTINDASMIAAPMSGSFSVTDAAGTRTCTSPNHLLTLRRQS